MKNTLKTTDRLTKATSSDAAAMSTLAARAYEFYIPVINAVPAPMSADYMCHIRDNEAWVIRDGDFLSASLILIHQNTHLLVESIAVDRSCQGQGLGKRLLEFSKARTLEAGYRDLRLYTNVLMTDNRAWYQRNGFKETGFEQRGDKLVVHMRCLL